MLRMEALDRVAVGVLLERFGLDLRMVPDGQPIPAGQSAADVGAVDMMPPHYSSPDRTIFTETISESGNEELTFQL